MNDTLAGYNVQETYSSARQIAEQVDMVHLLQALGFMVSPRTRRCACLLHGGNNRSAFSWTDNLWYCHVCHAGGDRIHLVRAVRDCSFHEAVGFLAALAGVDACGLDDARWESRQFATPESEERAACLLAATEHAKLLELSYELNQLRQLGEKARQWLAEQKDPELCWSVLKFVADTLPRTDAAYCIVAFDEPVNRARVVLDPDLLSATVTTVLERGYVVGRNGYRFNVPNQ